MRWFRKLWFLIFRKKYQSCCTSNHLILTKRGLVKAKDLTTDDVIIGGNGSMKVIDISGKKD